MCIKKQLLQPITFAILVSIILVGLDIELHLTIIKAIIIISLFSALILSCYKKGKALDKISTENETFSLIFDNCYKSCPDIIVCKDTNFNYTMCNETVKNLYKLNQSRDIIGKNIYDFLSKENADIVRREDEYVLRTGDISSYSFSCPEILNKYYNFVSIPILKNNKITGIVCFGRDISEEEYLRKKLKENHSQLTSIVNNLPLITYIIDLKGNYVLGNEKSYKFFEEGLDIENHIKLDINIIKKNIQKENDFVIKTKQIISKEKYYKATDGMQHWYDVRKAPWIDKDGNVVGVIVFARNIDIIKNAQKQRENYVATLSHDLKTPTLAQIRTIELLLRGSVGTLNPQQEKLLNLTLESCRYMYSMVNTLVSTYKYENGEMVLNYNEFNILELIEECINQLNNLIISNRITIRVQSFVKSPIVKADRIQIQRVLENLISNGLSYAYKDTTITILVNEVDLDKIQVKVINKSPFITKENINNIFKRYISHADKFNRVGAGLGLYLFKQIIEAHQGTIIAKSSKKNINTFGFIINK